MRLIFPLFSSFNYTVSSLLLLLGLVTCHFVTFGVHFLLKITHSNTKTIHQMLPSLCIVYQVLRSLCSHGAQPLIISIA
ncbi:hypothetical protein PO909_020863 [Leuciscus waleckii]